MSTTSRTHEDFLGLDLDEDLECEMKSEKWNQLR